MTWIEVLATVVAALAIVLVLGIMVAMSRLDKVRRSAAVRSCRCTGRHSGTLLHGGGMVCNNCGLWVEGQWCRP